MTATAAATRARRATPRRGSIRCTCGEGFVGDGLDCHPPGWNFVDRAPPSLTGVVYDKCRDRFIGKAAGASSLWSFDPALSGPIAYRRLGLDVPFEVLDDIPGEWTKSRLRLVGRKLVVPGVHVLEAVDRWGSLRMATFTFDVDAGRGWVDAGLDGLSDLCDDGPGTLLGFGSRGVVAIDARTLVATELETPFDAADVIHCFDAAPGGRAALVIPSEDGTSLTIASRDASGGWTLLLVESPPLSAG